MSLPRPLDPDVFDDEKHFYDWSAHAARPPQPRRPKKWPEPKVKALKKFWRAGITAVEIGQRLGGKTKNAVLGKAHRLNLSKRDPWLAQASWRLRKQGYLRVVK